MDDVFFVQDVDGLSVADLTQIFLAGDVMIDEYRHCEVTGVSPEAPILHLMEKSKTYQLGGAGNVALNLEALQRHRNNSIKFSFLGPLQSGIPSSLTNFDCFDFSFCTLDKPSIKTRLVSEQQQLIRYDNDFRISYENDLFLQFIKSQDCSPVGVVSDYAHGAITTEVLSVMSESCDVILLDPKGSDPNKYRGFVNLITPNLKELHTLIPNQLTDRIAALKLLEITEADVVILKRGGRGCSLYMKNEETKHFPPYRNSDSVVDVTGAGDTFIATLATCLAEKKDLLESTRIAVKMAGISVTKETCYVPEFKDVIEAFK